MVRNSCCGNPWYYKDGVYFELVKWAPQSKVRDTLMKFTRKRNIIATVIPLERALTGIMDVRLAEARANVKEASIWG